MKENFQWKIIKQLRKIFFHQETQQTQQMAGSTDRIVIQKLQNSAFRMIKELQKDFSKR